MQIPFFKEFLQFCILELVLSNRKKINLTKLFVENYLINIQDPGLEILEFIERSIDMNELEQARARIDLIDKQMTELFKARMHQCEVIADYKSRNEVPIVDNAREMQILEKGRELLDNSDMFGYYERFQKKLMEVSAEYQRSIIENKKARI